MTARAHRLKRRLVDVMVSISAGDASATANRSARDVILLVQALPRSVAELSWNR